MPSSIISCNAPLVFGFEPEEYAIALPKGDTVLADKINGALQEMMEDGSPLSPTYSKGGNSALVPTVKTPSAKAEMHIHS